ncbi:MAG TPA: hypothetical protein H9962_06185 [Candidatus Mailhella merdigallinarum]|uniref:Uncharacterized protein n=1 Tax=Candidatus Mailhella merdigallinarum TaxID=2838658 RepID=A0A9D2HCT3_9BACT|nr:hypothetical protein [Candidatus Mailhella merdigallinarum]
MLYVAQDLFSLTPLAAGMTATSAEAAPKHVTAPLVIQKQGSFVAGGAVISAKEPYTRCILRPPDRRCMAITPMFSIKNR